MIKEYGVFINNKQTKCIKEYKQKKKMISLQV